MVRWHSFQNGERPEWCKVTIRPVESIKHVDSGTSMASMSCGQLQVCIDTNGLDIFLRIIYRSLINEYFFFAIQKGCT